MASTLPGLSELALPAPDSLAPAFARDCYVVCLGALSSERSQELREQALELVERYARRIQQESAEHVLRYRVVPGDVIREHWPRLFAIYESEELRKWVAQVAGVAAVFNSTHLQSAININALGEPGEVYRWHTDAAGFTLLLYLTDSCEGDGGELELRPPACKEAISIRPAAGTVVLMDGTKCLHRATMILRRHRRISIPMVFTTRVEHRRPAGLDDYLYKPAS
jgi:hypothetical protein